MHDYLPLMIAAVRPETAQAIAVTLEVPAALTDTFRFRPGQHLPVRATIGGAEQRRTYSICCGPGEGGLRIAIKRVTGGLFSNWAGDTLKAGDTLDVMPPAGRFVLPDGGGAPRHLVALAAGAGITPILAMVKHALNAEPQTSFTLVYGNRSPDTILFAKELEDLKDRHLGRFTLLNMLSHSGESGGPLFEGRITGDKVKALAGSLFKPSEVAHVFLCGPGSMIKEARAALLALGMPAGKVHFELFGVRPSGSDTRAPAGAPSPRASLTSPDAPSAREEGRGEGQRHTPTSNGVRPLASDLSASLKRGGEGSDPIPASGEREPAHHCAPAAERDYYVVEDIAGRRFWLFRHGLYGSTPNPQWFVHGVFA
jgi:ring-1,2-phenylacetyl-CoA epoxidase subunit PaaE